jgi:uncharacterized membrane protein
MRKNEFLGILKTKLKNFNHSEVQKISEYYSELLADKMENGMGEEETVASLGEIDSIINQVTADLIMERSSDRKTNPLKNFLIILSICASPILIPIGITLFTVVIVLVAVLFSVFISFVAAGVSLLLMAIATSIRFLALGYDYGLIMLNAGGLLFAGGVLTGLSVLTFRFGKTLLNLIIKNFSRIIKKKAKGEVR